MNEQTLTYTPNIDWEAYESYVASVSSKVSYFGEESNAVLDFFTSFGMQTVVRLWSVGAIITVAYAIVHTILS